MQRVAVAAGRFSCSSGKVLPPCWWTDSSRPRLKWRRFQARRVFFFFFLNGGASVDRLALWSPAAASHKSARRKKKKKKIFPLSASSWGRSLGITVRKKRKEMKLLFFYFTLFGFLCFLPELTGKSCIVLCVVGVLSKLNLPFVMSLKGSDSFHLMSTTQTDKASVWAGGHKQRDKYAGHLHFCLVFLCVYVFVFQNLFSVVKVLLREQTYCCNQTFFFFFPCFLWLKVQKSLDKLN